LQSFQFLFLLCCGNLGIPDVERGERGSTEEHLTVTQFKVQAEQQRLETIKLKKSSCNTL